MTQSIIIDDSRYISAQDAATLAGFTRDYVSRLARSGKVDARRIAGNWFIEEKAFAHFVLEQQFNNRRRRQQLSDLRAREYRSFDEKTRRQKKMPLSDRIITKSEAAAHVAKMMAKAAAAPSGARAMRRVAQMHTPPVHFISPAVDFIHRVSALFMALVVTFGTYAAFDSNFAFFARNSFQNIARGITGTSERIVYGETPDWISLTADSVAEAVENPASAIRNSYVMTAAAMHAFDYHVTVGADAIEERVFYALFGGDNQPGDVMVEVVPVLGGRQDDQ